MTSLFVLPRRRRRRPTPSSRPNVPSLPPLFLSSRPRTFRRLQQTSSSPSYYFWRCCICLTCHSPNPKKNIISACPQYAHPLTSRHHHCHHHHHLSSSFFHSPLSHSLVHTLLTLFPPVPSIEEEYGGPSELHQARSVSRAACAPSPPEEGRQSGRYIHTLINHSFTHSTTLQRRKRLAFFPYISLRWSCCPDSQSAVSSSPKDAGR